MYAVHRPALIVHGGAGTHVTALTAALRSGLAAALSAGWDALAAGASALDAVCAAVVVMEDDPVFNAGVGSCLTSAGTVEMDASVMDGRQLAAGAVGVVRTTRHPVELARAVMQDGQHVTVAGVAADDFARLHHLAQCAPEDLVTVSQRERWQRRQTDGVGTVGAVAVDRDSHVAAATSTGGLFNKRPGRIGDSAVIGAGTYADDTRGAVSGTGQGEAIMRVTLAKRVVDLLADGTEPLLAARQGLADLARQVGGSGGLIVVDSLGRVGWAYNTPHMTVGYMRGDLAAPVVMVGGP